MAGSHDKLPRVFWVQIVLVLIVGLFYIFSPSQESHVEDGAASDEKMLAALEPIGAVEIKEEVAVAGAARAGADTSKRVCAVCHSVGLGNAPMLDKTAKADWEARMAGDMGALVKSAIVGKGAMPPRGGDPSLSDEEMYLAVADMLASSGIEAPAQSDVVMEAEVEEAPTAVVAKTGDETVKGVCAVCHSIGLGNAPKLEETAKADWEARMADGGLDALVQRAITGKGAMPPRGGAVDLTDEEVYSAVAVMLKSVGIDVPEKSSAVKAKPVEEAPAPVVAKTGDETVKGVCAVCHSIGLANAPKLDEAAKADWEARIADGGVDALVQRAIVGKGAMPPRGGAANLTDDEVYSAVAVMLKSAGIEVPEKSSAPVKAKPVEAPAPVVAKTGDETVKGVCSVCHSIGLANAPKLDESAKADWEARMADGGMDVLVQRAIAGKGAMPPRGGAVNLTDDEVYSAVSVMLKSAGVEVPVKTAAPDKTVSAIPEVVDIDTIVATKLGESTYKASCFVCHDTGVANAPIFADKLAWKARFDLGATTLYNSVLKGKGAMPAKAGNPALTDEAVVEAVNYIIVNSK